MTPLKSDRWIKAGYNLLAREAADTINVERIAKLLNANKSGFYHYFGTREAYFKELLVYHTRAAEDVAKEIALCKSIDPDLLRVVIKFKSFFLVESQLLMKSKSFHVDEDADVAGRIIGRALVECWNKIGGAPMDPAVVQAYLDIIRHFFYVRINADSMNLEALQELANKTKLVLGRVMSDKEINSKDASFTPTSQIETSS